MKKISQEKIDYIREHLDVPNTELGKILNIDRGTVRKYKKEMGVIYAPVKTYHEFDNYICDSYFTKTSTELAQEIGCSTSYISKVWKENGLSGKNHYRYFCDYNYFEKIDSASKSYILGFIASDGCLYKRDGHQGLIQISISEKDIQILEDIKTEMKSNHPINHAQNMISLSITSDKMFNDLIKLGIQPKKTWALDFQQIKNNIPPKFFKDFIRGYFDGDGSITSSNNFQTISHTTIKIAIPQTSGEILSKLLEDMKIKNSFYIDTRSLEGYYTKNFGSLEFKNTTEKYVFLKWIYSNPDELKLKRKYEKGIELINKIADNTTNRVENKNAVNYWEAIRRDI